MFKKNTILLLIAFFFLTAAANSIKSKKTKLEFTFHVNNKIGVQPSYQMTIWLEKPDGTFVKTLYVSDYLSYGGFRHKEICPDWNAKSNWESMSEKEVDGVTGATLMTGDQSLIFEFSKKQLSAGLYKYFIEVHLLEKYNELYTGEIEVGNKDSESVPKVTYIPEKHPKAGDLLSNIIVRCSGK